MIEEYYERDRKGGGGSFPFFSFWNGGKKTTSAAEIPSCKQQTNHRPFTTDGVLPFMYTTFSKWRGAGECC